MTLTGAGFSRGAISSEIELGGSLGFRFTGLSASSWILCHSSDEGAVRSSAQLSRWFMRGK